MVTALPDEVWNVLRLRQDTMQSVSSRHICVAHQTVMVGIDTLGTTGQGQQQGTQLTWCDRSASRKNTKSPLAKRSPCTYAVPRPSLPGRGRSSCTFR
jgi:hypothetical protein